MDGDPASNGAMHADSPGDRTYACSHVRDDGCASDGGSAPEYDCGSKVTKLDGTCRDADEGNAGREEKSKNACCDDETTAEPDADCKDACCDDSKSVKLDAGCKDACCDDETTAEPDAGCKDACCKDACCDDEKSIEPDVGCKDACCDSKPAKLDVDCKDACCPADNSARCEEKDNTGYTEQQDGCCSKTKAIRTATAYDTRASSAKKACNRHHLDSAFARYASFLDKGRCICRSVLDRYKVKCAPERTSSAASTIRSPAPAPSPVAGADGVRLRAGRKCEGACCDSNTPRFKVAAAPVAACKDACCQLKGFPAKQAQATGAPACRDQCCSAPEPAGTKELEAGSVSDCDDSCCDTEKSVAKAAEKLAEAPSACRDSCCCDNEKPAAKAAREGVRTPLACQDSCCESKALVASGQQSCSLDDVRITSLQSTEQPRVDITAVKSGDIEYAAAREHMVLTVSGMACTGCSRKATNVLDNVDGVSSVKVTFVTGMAEFDLDTSVAEPQQVVARIEKETGFKFSRIFSNLQAIELTIPPSAAKAACDGLRHLADSVEKAGKSTYRVSYDPLSVDARALVASHRGISLAPPGNDAKVADGRRKLIHLAMRTAGAAAFAIPVVVLAWSDSIVPDLTRSIVELVLATAVQAIAVPEFYVRAVKSLVYSKVLEMDMLVVISITAAYGYSLIAFALTRAGYTLQTAPFFETSSLLITLVLVGRLVAAVAKVRAVSAVSVRSLQAEKALLVEAEGGDATEIDARLLALGDVFVVPAHARVVTDGEVIRGTGSVDESMLTGEGVPVPKSVGDQLIAGTTNGPAALTVRLTRLPGKNSITDIAKLVESALAAKPHIQDAAETAAGYFVQVIMAISVIVFAIWIAIALRVHHDNGGGAVGTAITYAIAVLAISCPCALGLAVPMVLVIAGGVAARRGVVIRQADAIERSHKVTDVVFDKTGTITSGELDIVHESTYPTAHLSEADIFMLAKALAKDNQHPVALAVAARLQRTALGCDGPEKIESIPGSGVQAQWRGSTAKAGNPFWLGVEQDTDIGNLIAAGMSLFCVTLDSALVAAFGLKANIRREAASVIKDLQRQSITCHLVSGDGPQAVSDVARAVGIAAPHVASRHTPAQKQRYVEQLMSAGDRTVLFCGDGTNDAVAVAQADVGVQLGSASDVTRATADVVLLGGLDGLPTLLHLSRSAARRIAFNFLWSAVYNLLAVLLAAGAFVGFRIPPAYAGLGELVSVSPVVLAAMTLVLPGAGRRR